MSDEGCISTMDALNAVDSLSSKIMKQEAVHLIESQWVETDRWLKGVPLLSELSTDPDQVVLHHTATKPCSCNRAGNDCMLLSVPAGNLSDPRYSGYSGARGIHSRSIQ